MREKENKLAIVDNEMELRIKNVAKKKLPYEDYKEKLSQIKSEKVLRSQEINQDYSGKLKLELLYDLKQDYALMGKKSIYLELSKTELQDMHSFDKVLSNMTQASKDFLFKKRFPKTKGILSLDDLKNIAAPSTITSYVASNGVACSLLSPIHENNSDALSKDLKNKLYGITSQNRIALGGDNNLYFALEREHYPNGFMVLNFITSKPSDLARELIKKLNDNHIQPGLFKKNNITHKAISIDLNQMKNFLEMVNQ
jgi:hypothetical protein